jgi:hypothetical protein
MLAMASQRRTELLWESTITVCRRVLVKGQSASANAEMPCRCLDVGQSYPSQAAFRRPLPSPATVVSTNGQSPSSAYTRDRQRSLPQPSLGTMRTMPSMPALRNCLPSPVGLAAEQFPLPDQAIPLRSDGQSLARHASTPNLHSGSSRRLLNPPSVTKMEPLSELPVDSNGAASPTIPARSRALPTPGHASGRPVFNPGMDHSDTVSSIKSLDRWELTRHARSPNCTPTTDSPIARPLPLPPVSAAKSGLAPSRSLDRGIPRHGGFLGMSNTIPFRTSEVRPATGPIAASSRTLPAAPSTEHINQKPVVGATSCTPVNEGRPRQISANIGLSIDTEVVKVGEGHGSVLSAPTQEEVPVLKIAPPPKIVLPDSEDVPEISVTGAATPSIPCISIDLPESPRKTTRDSDPGCNAIVDRQVPNVIISSGSGPSIRVAQPAPEVLSNPSSPSTNHSGPGIFCSACDLVILGSIINAAGKRWHPDCLRCTTCGVGLEHVSRYDHDGMPYCHMDYHEVSTLQNVGGIFN